MNILAYLALWKRPAITAICFDGLVRLQTFAKTQGITLSVLCVGSESSMEVLCKQYGFAYTHFKNDDLGAKKNHGLSEAMKIKGWQYLLELGSDDLIKNELLTLYKSLFEAKVMYFCPSSIAFLNSADGSCRKYKSDTVFGAGRIFHRSVLQEVAYCYKVQMLTSVVSTEKVLSQGDVTWVRSNQANDMARAGQAVILEGPTYKLWQDEQQCKLDGVSDYACYKAGFNCQQIKTLVPLVLDIKSHQNLWKYNPEAGTDMDLADAMDGLSKKEINGIKKLIANNRQLQPVA